jgi:hypothetical protein
MDCVMSRPLRPSAILGEIFCVGQTVFKACLSQSLQPISMRNFIWYFGDSFHESDLRMALHEREPLGILLETFLREINQHPITELRFECRRIVRSVLCVSPVHLLIPRSQAGSHLRRRVIANFECSFA